MPNSEQQSQLFEDNNTSQDNNNARTSESVIKTNEHNLNDATNNKDLSEMEINIKFQSHLREWAITHQITHTALKDLIKLLNIDTKQVLPEDPRTLLRTPQKIVCFNTGRDGVYWHHGFEKCIKLIFHTINEPKTVSINVNLDGLPIFNSSKVEFWPILFNIYEMPEVPPKVIGIFSGKNKCTDLEKFLSPFVDELKKAMTHGIVVNSHKVSVKVRCFICDSPARAYIKGVANFNAHQGCQKCTTIGEFNYISNTNIFPRTVCEKRTNEKFRQKLYGAHHKYDSPLLRLDIDMVEQFPVGDSLHLLHLGIMKRLLFGWRDGTFRLSNTKWPARTTIEISTYLKQCKMPTEVHRSVRELDCLAHWKGTEYRTFMCYIGVVALKDYLTNEAYVHFLLIFCAVTICSSKQYFNLLPTARAILLQFKEIFAEIYGEHHLTSNVHNLSHLVDEVELFGNLDSFSAYPFENALGKIKRLLRNGHLPLPQIAKRMIENFNCQTDITRTSFKSKTEVRELSKPNGGINVPDFIRLHKQEYTFYSKVQLKDFCLRTDEANCWFLTTDNKIIGLNNIIHNKKKG